VRDPHVEKLRYQIEVAAPAIFSEAPPFEVNATAFCVCFESLARELTVAMIEHHATEESARARVDPFLRAWEIEDAITVGRPQLSFRFERAELVDRNPSPPEFGASKTVKVSTLATARALGGLPTVTASRPFPKPPTGFAVSPDVETLFQRWLQYLSGGEPLPGMANFCLTVLQAYGGRHPAAKHFAVSRNVLDRIGTLVSHSGSPLSARKADAMARPLTDREAAWLEAAIKALIRRAGELAAQPDGSFGKITMATLPPL
jgi:hypothetical protein